MSAKRVQDIFHALCNLERTADSTPGLTDEPTKFRKRPDSLRARVDSVRPSSAWDIHIGKLDTESPGK